MLTTGSVVLCNVSVEIRQRFRASSSNPSYHSAIISKHNHKCRFLRNSRLQNFSGSLGLRYAAINTKMYRHMAVFSGFDPGFSDPSPFLWILGFIITVVLPFWRNKWWPLIMIKDKVDSVVETAEHVAEVVEGVAEEVAKVAEEVADHLPEGGKLKATVTFVENVAKETAKDAHIVDQTIEKIEEAEEEVKSVIEQVAHVDNGMTKEAKDLTIT